MLCEMQSVSSRIWTRVAVSISYDDNDYTTGTSTKHNFDNLNAAVLSKKKKLCNCDRGRMIFARKLS